MLLINFIIGSWVPRILLIKTQIMRTFLKVFLSYLFISTLLFYFFFYPTHAKAQNVDNLISLYAKQGKEKGIKANFNGVVLIAKNNEIVFNKAYGYSNFETKKTLNVADKFLIGSVTKPIVAYLVLKQVERGKIKLDQNITDFLPEYDHKKGKKITVRMLLNHTSGIPHYAGLLPHVKSKEDFFKSAISTKDYVTLINKVGLINIPGEKHQYSSLGYILLGAILEKVTELPFSEIIRKELNQDLGLKNLGFTTDTSTGIVKDYVIKGENYKEFPNRHQSNTLSTGGLYANSTDLFTFFNKLRNSEILKTKFTRKMFDENNYVYSLGLYRNDAELLRYIPSARYFSHGGSVNQFSSYVMLNDDGTTIIVLTNTRPLHLIKFIANIYRTYKGEDLSTLSRVILPSLKNVPHFNEENGIEGVINYHKRMSENAGFPVYPSASYLVKLVKIHRNRINTKSVDKLIDLMTVKDNPHAEDTLNRLAYLLLKIDQNKAEKYFKKAVKLFPKSANAWDSLGEYYEMSNNIEQAKTAYKKAVTLSHKFDLENQELYLKNLKRTEK